MTMMKPANPRPISAAKPRQRATPITTIAKITPTTSSGVLPLEVGELILGRLVRSGWHPYQLDDLADLDPRGVDRGGHRHRDRRYPSRSPCSSCAVTSAQRALLAPGVDPVSPSQEISLTSVIRAVG